MSIFTKLKGLLEKGHERTVKAKKNVILAALYKGIGMLVGFAYFPISIKYMGAEKFGIFLALVSMIDMFGQLDAGIGNGLRNRLGEAIADENDEEARGYVSTAFFALGAIFSGAVSVLIIVSWFLPWADLINDTNPELVVDSVLGREIALLAMLMFAALVINFVSSLVYQVFYALQKVAMVDLFKTLGKVAFLVVIIILFYTTSDSLLLFGVAKSFTFAFVPLAVAIYYFRNDFKQFRPAYKYVGKRFFQGLFTLGIQFFIIKICMIIIHQTNNILIIKYVGPEDVTKYEAVYKYISIFLMLFVILTNQLWSASIEAYRKQDMVWLKETLWSIQKIWMWTIVGTVFMIFISPFIFGLWLPDTPIPMLLTMAVGLSISITTWVNLYNLMVNGTGKIRVQMYTWILASILNIPVSVFFAVGLNLGSVGIVLGTVASMLPLAIISPIQVRKILNQKDTGIWAE